MEETREGCSFFGLSIVGLFGLFVIGMFMVGGLFIVGSIVQRTIINPQVKQNIIDNPQTVISNRQDFHNKLGDIIAADQDIQNQLNAIARCDNHCDNEDTLNNDLIGIENIRTQLMASYNAESANPDTGKDREAWMPAYIDVTTIPVDSNAAQSFLTTEINHLQGAYNKGV